MTDENLFIQLKNSHLADEQKEKLAPMITYMTDADRENLLGLIAESNDLANPEQSPEQVEKLRQLNEKYKMEMNTIVRDSSRQARIEFENLDKESSVQEEAKLEAELKTL